MTTLYKLTDQDGYTHRGKSGETFWQVGKTVTALGKEGQPLCTDGWLHAYEHPLIAVFMNPIHARINNPRMFKVEGTVGLRDGALKCGARCLEVIEEVKVPALLPRQRAFVNIKIARRYLRNYSNSDFTTWDETGAIWVAWAARDKLTLTQFIQILTEAVDFHA